jgi:hypothetical protein
MMAILRRYPAGVALGLMLGSLALPTMAEPPANNNGLMTFPNVRVQSAPVPAKAPTPAAREDGMKAYINPATGALREPNAADTEASNLNHQAPLFSRTPGNLDRSSIASAAAAPEIIYGPGNTESVVMGEESMVFQVARRDADGKLTQECVTGESHANHALHSPKAPRAQTQAKHEGSHNDR